jgi:hypothetical protein
MWAFIRVTINLYMHREKAGKYVPAHFQKSISRPGMSAQEPICGKRETFEKCSFMDGHDLAPQIICLRSKSDHLVALLSNSQTVSLARPEITNSRPYNHKLRF